MNPALERFLAQLRGLADVIIDSWFVVDEQRTIVDFNRAFFSLLPRAVARGLKGKKCYDVLELDICKGRCVGEQCWRDKHHLRLDGILGHPAAAPKEAKSEASSEVGLAERELRFVVSALPIFDGDGRPVGLLEVQRNVTDDALIQAKYQAMLDNEARERERLAGQIRTRTRELLETNEVLLRLQKELAAYKKGLMI